MHAGLITGPGWQDAAGLRRCVISSRRHVQILPLLIAVCRLTLAFPTQTPSAFDDIRQLQVNIPHSGPVSTSLGSSISIPCLVSLSSSSPVAPRVKWTVVSGGVETQILVARGQRVKVNEAYRDRAAWLNYTSSPDDLSLWLGDLRSSDSGHYRCEVQQGLEDASDLVQLKVKGVVFHYRDALGRYAFSFHQAQRACEAIGAQITTPDQLLAAYYDGYEQCDAGWLADQSVRYPIQVPREGCYGDMDGQPGVRNYGTMDPDHLFDAYCYVEETEGEVFHDSIPQQLSFDEAQSHCRATGAELATTAQLYMAWHEGLDRCSPGWLADGSVRYPIMTPRERCGGPQPGVKTLYRFSNQTGFPQPSSLHDVYCFRRYRNTPTDSPMDNVATEPEDIGQDVIVLMETDQELQLNQHVEQVELKAEKKVNVAQTLGEEVSITPTLEEEENVTPTFEEDFTVFPLDSQTSNWALLTTTTGPQESLNDLEYSIKNSPTTSNAALQSSLSTKPTAANTKTTIRSNTHWSRRTWSPTTSAPDVFHKTAEPRKVSTFIPPVDQGLVDVEFSLTQPPTLLILPNQRAAVGGTGKASVVLCFVPDACVNDPCLNGGTCTDWDGQIQCLCLPSYGGGFCQTDLERCEPGWDKFHGFCYRHFSQRLSWEVAEQHCRMLGAHLVSIITPEEQTYINNNYKEYQWTGLNDKTIEDDFRWSDGNPMLYENWYKGQPDSYFLSGEDCVVMVWHDEGRWSDVPCNYHLAYTCKKGTSSCGPPPKVRNTSIFGKGRQRYETKAVVRYHCAPGFQQRLTPLIRCLSGGRWERPQVLCIPEAGGPTQHPEVTSQTNDKSAAIEDEFEATKETPQYWDIKF
ncbi:brevican core protein-like [Cyclopterus lumpus]|uniref:brevican core protein-like n=1 Tax=Cyclopterus lumpus TaxID=8103 RepID=UPI0014862E98|nr:brevican core protein-like [Cyclopterus lumpus]